MATVTGANYTTFLARAAEVAAARDAYASLDARLDAIVASGGNVATLTNGAASAGQKNVTVDSVTGFIAGARVAYTLAGGTIEYNVIASISDPTLVMTTNIGTGGISDNTYISMISPSEYAAANAINRTGSLTLPQAMGYAAGNVYNAQSYGVSPANSAATNTAALQALVDLAASSGPGVILFPFSSSYYDFAKAGTSAGGVKYAVNVPNPASSLWFVGQGAKLRTTGVVNGTSSTHFCLFLVEALTVGAAKGNIHWRNLTLSGENTGATAGSYADNRGILLLGQYITDCTVEGCTARHFYSAGIGAFCGPACYRLSIRDCDAYENGENGINWNVPDGGQIIGNRCWGNVSGGIEASVTRSLIMGNQCWENLRGIAVGGFTAVTDEGIGNLVTGNICRDNEQYGLALSAGTRYSLVVGNTVFRNGDQGIIATEDLVTYPGIYTRNNMIRDNLVYANGLTANVGTGIYISAESNYLYNNQILPGAETGYTQDHGVLLNSTYCNNTHVVGNYSYGHTNYDYALGTQTGLVIDCGPRGATFEVIGSSGTALAHPNRGLRQRIASGASFTASVGDELLFVFSSPTTITLPLAASYPAGTPLYIKDKQGTAGTNTITITTSGSDTIESSGASITITTNYGLRVLVSDGGTGWVLLN